MGLPQLLDEVGHIPFSAMSFLAAKPVAKELCACGSDSAMNAELKRLTDAQHDTLMKVVYCCLANDHKNSSVYFKWHGALFVQAGSGAILRCLTDKPPLADGDASSGAATPTAPIPS